MKKDLNELDAQGVKTITVVSSPTKPGSGWVRVTPENIQTIEDQMRQSAIIRKKIAIFFTEVSDEMNMTAEELRAWIYQDENK